MTRSRLLAAGMAALSVLAAAPAWEPASAQEAAAPPPLPERGPATPPPLPDRPAWWIEEGGTAGGPYTREELRERLAAGRMTAGTLAWTEGQADWAPASEIEALRDLLPPAASPGLVAEVPGGDPVARIVGTWRSRGEVAGDEGATARSDMTVECAADGTYRLSGTSTVDAAGQALAMQVEGSGTFVAEAAGPDRVTVTSTGTATATPPEGLAPPTTREVGSTTTYEFQPDGSLRDVDTGDVMTPG